MRVNFFTVGTRKHVGTVSLNLIPYNKRNDLVDLTTWESMVQDMFAFAPDDHVPDLALLRDTTDSFYKLEREVWHDIYLKKAEAKAREEVEAKIKREQEVNAKIEEEAKARVEEVEQAEPESKESEEIDAQPKQDSAEPSKLEEIDAQSKQDSAEPSTKS